jgi:formate dehydrogenase maturation protein FdhE
VSEPREVLLLKHGKPAKYLRCDTCGHYSRWLSIRGWCEKCEAEFAGMKRLPPVVGESGE